MSWHVSSRVNFVYPHAKKMTNVCWESRLSSQWWQPGIGVIIKPKKSDFHVMVVQTCLTQDFSCFRYLSCGEDLEEKLENVVCCPQLEYCTERSFDPVCNNLFVAEFTWRVFRPAVWGYHDLNTMRLIQRMSNYFHIGSDLVVDGTEWI